MWLFRMEKPDEDEEFDKLDHILEQSGCLKELEESKECQVDFIKLHKCKYILVHA